MKRKSLTEKFLYKDEYFSEMLDKEREYRACKNQRQYSADELAKIGVDLLED